MVIRYLHVGDKFVDGAVETGKQASEGLARSVPFRARHRSFATARETSLPGQSVLCCSFGAGGESSCLTSEEGWCLPNHLVVDHRPQDFV